MSIRDDFFTQKTNGAKWDVGVSINRTNPLPLDVNSVFDTKANLDAYVAGVLSYPGQLVALVEATGTTIYYIDENKALQEVGKKPIGDNNSISVAEDGTISLTDFATAATGAQLVKGSDGKISWQLPDTTTVDGLGSRLTTLEGNVSNNYYTKTEVDAKDAGAFHFKGTASKFENEKLYDTEDTEITGNTGDVYQVGDKEYAYNGSAWVELGFTLDLSNYYTKTETDNAISTAINTAKTELQTYADTAEADANTYTDTAISNLEIDTYAKTTAVNTAIDTAKSDLTSAIATAKSEAISEAGTNADTKIATKVGDLGKNEDETDKTVKQYVDAKETALNISITNVSNSLSSLSTTVDNLDLKALAHKDKVAEADLETELANKINAKADATTVTSNIATAKSEAIAAAKQYTDDNAYDDTALQASVTANKNSIDAINHETTGILAQSKAYTDSAKDTLNTAIETNKTNIATNTAAIATLNGDENTDGSVLKIAKEQAATKVAEIVAGADTSYDTLKEIADWILNDTTGAAKMANDISTVIGTDTDKSMRTVAQEEAASAVGAIPAATQDTLGLLKGTDGKVNVTAGQITSITTDALVQGTEELILNGGTAV